MRREEEKLVNDCEVEDIMRNELNETDDFEDKWVFPKPRYYLATALDSDSLRPLSPTLKEHSPESVLSAIARLNEGFDNKREWKNKIEFVRSITKKKSLFNSRHHWDMRTKFLDVRLRCMDKIVEDPYAIRLPVTEFYVPMDVYEAIEDKKQKKALDCQSKTEGRMKKDEMVSEEIDNDGVPDEVLPSARKLKYASCVNDDKSQDAMSTTPSTCDKGVEQGKVNGITHARTISMFDRLRRRIRTLFSCFGNNQVTPVNI